MDVDRIPFGVDFRKHLDEAVSQCDILLAVIGEDWLEVRFDEGPRQGQRRLDDPADYVRIEIVSALARGIPVIPVLVGRARMPSEQELPDNLKDLAYRHASEARSGPHFHDHVSRLIRGIEYLVQQTERATQELVQLRQEGEKELARLLREALDRTKGQPTAEDTAAVNMLVRSHKIPGDRARTLVGEVREQWKQARPPKRKVAQIESLDLGKGVRMDFTWVPPRSFWMGGGGASPGDKQVEIAEGFALGIHPVTQAQWRAVMGNNPSWFSRIGDGKDDVKSISDADLWQFPVEQVSWKDVEQFLVKLNEREHGSEWTYRLPTEAEWEYSCRGGLTSKEECSFHFYFDRPANDLSSDRANFHGNYPDGSAKKGTYLERTTKVGSYRPNRLGLYDMHGNVWEWCGDWYTEGSSRVIQGGGWGNHGAGCRAANRGGSAPSYRSLSLGFRLARVPSSK